MIFGRYVFFQFSFNTTVIQLSTIVFFNFITIVLLCMCYLFGGEIKLLNGSPLLNYENTV